MEKKQLTDWVAISEVVGNAAVVISLLIVAFSVAQNTRVIRAQIDNDWYQVHHENLSDQINDTSILALRLKDRRSEDLSELEAERMWYLRFKDLIMWEQAFVRFNDGLVDPAQWQRTDKAFSLDILDQNTEARWPTIRPFMRHDFAEHVDAVFEKVR